MTQTQNNLFVTQQQKTHTHVTKIYKYIIICVVRIRRPALRSMLIAIMQATNYKKTKNNNKDHRAIHKRTHPIES